MPLPPYTPPTKAISLPGSVEQLVVRGLSFEHVVTLVQEHLPDITLAVEKYAEMKGEVFSTRGADAFVTTLMAGFPGLAATVIATAAGSPDGADQVRAYPVGVQVAALVAVMDLTLDDMGALKDPSPALASLLRQATGVTGARVRSLLDTSGQPDAPSAGS